MIFSGQESAAVRDCSLFEIDPIAWGGYELQPWLTRLSAIKKERAQTEGRFMICAAEPAVQAAWHLPGDGLHGIFNVRGFEGQISVPLADGCYHDLLGDREVRVKSGRTAAPPGAVILRRRESDAPPEMSFELFDDLAARAEEQ